MEKVKKFLLSVNFNVLVFVLIGLRIAFVGANIGDALAILALCSLQAFNKWSDSQVKEDVNEKLSKELTDIKSQMSAILIKNSVRPPTSTSEAPTMKRFF